jgi:phospholipase C
MRTNLCFLAAFAALAALCGCSSGGSVTPATNANAAGGSVTSVASANAPEAMPAAGVPVGKYIKHVIVIIQENRSFDNFFAGYPGSDSQMYGYNKKHKKVPLQAITFDGPDWGHDWATAMTGWDNGKMDGFDQFSTPSGQTPYAYVKRSLIKPYWTMAHEYVLADHMFPTEFGGSYTAHFDLIAGTFNLTPDLAEVDNPQSTFDCEAPKGTKSNTINEERVESFNTGPYPCFNQFVTMANTLDAAHVSWKYYATGAIQATIWSPFAGIKYVRYGPDWATKVVAPETKILTDPGQGNLAQVSWVTPDLKNSDHPMAKSDTGPSWVAGVVNAVGKSRYWSTSAIVVIWDDWGGWYDNVPPPQKDFVGLGIRVGCIIISPYAKKNYVSHTVYEYGSILKFIEEAFNLPSLSSLKYGSGYTDTRANSLLDSFDFTQKPRAFKPIPAPYPPTYLLAQPPSNQPPDYE